MKPGVLRAIHRFTRALALTTKPVPSPTARLSLPRLRHRDCHRHYVHLATRTFFPTPCDRTQPVCQFYFGNTGANLADIHPDEYQLDIMGDTRSISTTSSGGGKRKRGAIAYFAVRKGRNPGIYYSWPDTQEQVHQFSGAEYKKFSLYTDAEAFMRAGVSSASPRPKSAKEKWYGVQVGHSPGVYTDYDEVKRQIRGYPGSKQQRFSTREEAQAFVDARLGSTPAYTSVASTAPSIKDDVGSEISLAANTAALRKIPKTSENPSKRQKRFDAVPPVLLPNGELDPGTGPLPEDAEDGFDRNIILRPDTGRIEFKTEAELNARKWQPTGETTDPLVIYTDGAAPGNGQLGAVAGIGVYFGPENPNNVSAWLGEGRQTNQRAELAAIKRAVDLAPINRNVLIISDSHYAIKCVTEWFRRWEANDWKTAGGKSVDNRDLVEPCLDRIRERALAGGQTKFEWVKGHSNNVGNVAADRLAVQGAEIGRQMIALQRARTAGEVGIADNLQSIGDDEEVQDRGEEWSWINQN